MTDSHSDDEEMMQLRRKKKQQFKQDDSEDEIQSSTLTPSISNQGKIANSSSFTNVKPSENLETLQPGNMETEKEINTETTDKIDYKLPKFSEKENSPQIDTNVTQNTANQNSNRKEEIFNKNSFYSKKEEENAINPDSTEKHKISNNFTDSDMTNIHGGFVMKTGFSTNKNFETSEVKREEGGGFTGRGDFGSNRNQFGNNGDGNRGFINRNNMGFNSGNRFGDNNRDGNNNFRGNYYNNRRGGGGFRGNRDRDDQGPRGGGGGFGRPFDRNDRNYNRGNDGFEFKKSSHIDDFTFYKDNKEIIDDILKNFTYLDENSIIEILKITILDTGNTIFELMNELSRKNIINKNIGPMLNRPKNFTDRVPIYETHERNLSNAFEFMLKKFKVNSQNSNSDGKLTDKEYYLNGKDRRRSILRDMDGYYNYIPDECKAHPISEVVDMNSDQCIYAHNDYEINYHSLMYKTKLCKKSECEKLCPKAHNLGDEFRRIYDYRNKGIIDLTVKLENCQLLKNCLINYMTLFDVPTTFSLDTFKTMECKLPNYCGQDPHLCLNYHNEQERRRPAKLFKLVNEICKFAQPGKDSDFYPHLCQLRDHCEKIHTRYELLYHQENFRKIKPCTRSKEAGRCKFFLTCYGIHPEDSGIYFII